MKKKVVAGYVVLTIVFIAIQVLTFSLLNRGIFSDDQTPQKLVINQNMPGVEGEFWGELNGEYYGDWEEDWEEDQVEIPDHEYAVGFELPAGYASIEEYLANLPEIEIVVPSLDNATFVLQDRTRVNEVSQPFFAIEDFQPQPGQLTLEEAGVLVAELIEANLGENINGRLGTIEYWGIGQDGGAAEWTVAIFGAAATSFEDWDNLEIFIVIEADTGEIKSLEQGPFAG